MELTAVLLEKCCMLELTWAPGLQNVLVDSLTNGDYKQFDPKLRMKFFFCWVSRSDSRTSFASGLCIVW